MSAPQPPRFTSVTLLPLGDSITEGVPTADGYRGYLTQRMAASGVVVNYIGSRRTPAGQHEGWSGCTTAELIPRARATLARERPEAVLLHIGTNDLGQGLAPAQIAEHVRQLLELIEAVDLAGRNINATLPAIVVYLARIIPRDLFGDAPDEALVAYNRALEGLAGQRRALGQPVVLVDVHAALDPRTDLADALHPNPAGYRKIAQAWAAALLARAKK